MDAPPGVRGLRVLPARRRRRVPRRARRDVGPGHPHGRGRGGAHRRRDLARVARRIIPRRMAPRVDARGAAG
ncbi:MAG: hypothetical protein ACK559_23945, partial [bacterium]